MKLARILCATGLVGFILCGKTDFDFTLPKREKSRPSVIRPDDLKDRAIAEFRNKTRKIYPYIAN